MFSRIDRCSLFVSLFLFLISSISCVEDIGAIFCRLVSFRVHRTHCPDPYERDSRVGSTLGPGIVTHSLTGHAHPIGPLFLYTTEPKYALNKNVVVGPPAHENRFGRFPTRFILLKPYGLNIRRTFGWKSRRWLGASTIRKILCILGKPNLLESFTTIHHLWLVCRGFVPRNI